MAENGVPADAKVINGVVTFGAYELLPTGYDSGETLVIPPNTYDVAAEERGRAEALTQSLLSAKHTGESGKTETMNQYIRRKMREGPPPKYEVLPNEPLAVPPNDYGHAERAAVSEKFWAKFADPALGVADPVNVFTRNKFREMCNLPPLESSPAETPNPFSDLPHTAESPANRYSLLNKAREMIDEATEILTRGCGIPAHLCQPPIFSQRRGIYDKMIAEFVAAGIHVPGYTPPKTTFEDEADEPFVVG